MVMVHSSMVVEILITSRIRKLTAVLVLTDRVSLDDYTYGRFGHLSTKITKISKHYN